MTQSAPFALCQAAGLLLQAAPSLAAGGVRVGRRRPMPSAVSEQVFVFFDESQAQGASLSTLQWVTRLRIECVARDTATASAEAAADALAQAAYARIMADPQFAGLAIDTAPVGMAIDMDEADTTLSACQVLFDVKHRTPRASVAATS